MILHAFLILSIYIAGVTLAIPALHYINKDVSQHERTGINACWCSWIVVILAIAIWLLSMVFAIWDFITQKLPNYISPKIKDAYAALDKFVQHNYER